MVREVAGPEIQHEAQAVTFRQSKRGAKTPRYAVVAEPLGPGDCFATSAYRLSRRGIQRVYHAVLTPYPGGIASLASVSESIEKSITQAVAEGLPSLAIPAMGVRESHLDPETVAGIALQAAKGFEHLLEIRFVDTHEEFIRIIKERLTME